MRAVTRRAPARLSGVGSLPTEFRLFVAGWNETTHGSFLFDAEAARLTMEAFEAHGVDLAIDVEHQMLDDEPSPDPTARDARGWCRLEVRAGELWAVDVRWTDDGAARLTGKRQRYVSPAFEVEPRTSRVLKIINVAITSTPATYETPALVAANQKRNMMHTKKPTTSRVRRLSSDDARPEAVKIRTIAAVLEITDPTQKNIEDAIAALFASEDEALRVLSAREVAMCKSRGISLDAYIARRRARGALPASPALRGRTAS